MSSPSKRLSPIKTPKYHRSVFGNTSPNLINQSTNSIFTGTNGILSPNFNVVNSDWNSKLKSPNKKPSAYLSSRKSSHLKNRTLGDLFNEKYTSINSDSHFIIESHSKNNDKNNGDNKNFKSFKNKSTSNLTSSTRKLRRTNTNELLDRFIPSRQTTSGKLTIEKTKSLPSFALPSDRIESQRSEIYQNTVAEACGLEVGQRILQFQPIPPESKNSLRRVASHNSNSLNCKFKTRQMISTIAAQERMKKIPSCPVKVLDAPGIIDDFYLNLISWSDSNILAIALQNDLYCWNANDGSVNLITSCETIITSIKWSPDDFYISIGLENGNIEIWDIETRKNIRTLNNCGNVRIASQGWNNHLLTSGSRTGQILNNDVRISNHVVNKLENHTGEVCGLKWRHDGIQLASGGNDNIVNIWDYRNSVPIYTKTAHNSAVKAIAWCPTQTSLLATGGGYSCKKIHFWNTNTGSRINTIETESPITSLHWGYSNGVGKEIVSTHGLPNNEISIYSYPSLQKTGVIIDAHGSRILSSELSPDRTVLATISPDENLKFWKMFDVLPEEKSDAFSSSSTAPGKSMEKVMTIR
jgi:cell division cycle protein 20 (cofactor of APC complex)